MTTPPTNQPTFLCFYYSWRVLRQVIPLFVVARWLLHFFLFTHLFIRCLFFNFLSCSIYKCCSFYQAKFMITRSRANQSKNSNYHCGRVPAVLYKRIVFTITLDLLSHLRLVVLWCDIIVAFKIDAGLIVDPYACVLCWVDFYPSSGDRSFLCLSLRRWSFLLWVWLHWLFLLYLSSDPWLFR